MYKKEGRILWQNGLEGNPGILTKQGPLGEGEGTLPCWGRQEAKAGLTEKGGAAGVSFNSENNCMQCFHFACDELVRGGDRKDTVPAWEEWDLTDKKHDPTEDEES